METDRLQAEIWKLTLPFRAEIHTVIGRMSSSTDLIVLMRDGEGHSGASVTGIGRAIVDQAVAMALLLLRECQPRLSTLIGMERFEERFLGFQSGGLSKTVASAISLAVWDLIGHREGIACADLWGRQAGGDRLDCYASGFFMEVATEELAGVAQQFLDDHFRYIKMRPSTSIQHDLERVRVLQSVYPEPGTIALDAFNSWSVRTAQTFIQEAQTRFLWIEDPTPYSVIGQLADSGALIAAGETCESPFALTGLLSKGVRYLIPDVGRLGGPMRFLEAARGLSSLGAMVGGHVYPYYSAHLLACLPDSLPVEMTEWQDSAFEAPPRPDADGKLAVVGPGFGVKLDQEKLERYGERLAVI